MYELIGKYTSAKIMIDDVEGTCLSQIISMINHPAFTNPVVLMPDTHYGKGSTIGFTMPLSEKVIPAVVGVDIGCGMNSVNIGNTLSMSFDALDQQIRSAIPFGMNVHDRGVIHMEKEFPWDAVTSLARNFVAAYNQKFNTSFHAPNYSMKWFEVMCERTATSQSRAISSIGSLGGGNHFIEIGQSTNEEFWVTIHTGSRNLGSRVCDYWQDLALKNRQNQNKNKLKGQIEEIKKTHKGKEIQEEIRKLQNYDGVPADKDHQFLTDQDAMGYLFDMIFCQKYAQVNRQYLMEIILSILGAHPIDTIETVHNFIDFRDFVIRKGAIRSYVGERMIIPFNMRDGILLCEGKSNPEWNFSAPHGAGRVMSRSKAKQTVNLEEFQESMKGIFSTSVGRGTLDESPMVYKDAKIIEEAIEPTATIIDKIKPVMNMKDGEGERA